MQRFVTLTIALMWLAAECARAQTFETLVAFDWTHGGYPYGALVQGLDGNLYGTTFNGGAYACPPATGCGTIFRVSFDGALITLHSFGNRDGENPATGLTQDAEGSFYGTTNSGGSSDYGTVYRFVPQSALTTLHSFDNQDGSYPDAPLLLAANGDFYGSTSYGFSAGGTIFRIGPEGAFTLLDNFAPDYGEVDCLVQAPDGSFYGTSAQGGDFRAGSFFQMTAAGAITTLFSFTGTNGNFPTGIVQVPNGSYYGTTEYGPGANGNGIFFEINARGQYTPIHLFTAEEGSRPGPILLGSDGNFYGALTMGGTNGLGSIYRITPQGVLTILHAMNESDGGGSPSSPLYQATDGKFYGGTSSYGFAGTLFRVSVGLAPFVKTLPHFGSVGTRVTLLGTNLEHASHVSFNATSAPFTILSPTAISAIVPDGATTGNIEVITPAGRLFSGDFIVKPSGM